MFSFFKSSKKTSPSGDDPPSDGGSAVSSPSHQNNPDGFVMVGGSGPQSSLNGGGGTGMYPSLGGNYSGGYGGPAASTTPQHVKRQDSLVNFHYLEGVPFKLANEISTGGDATEIERIQVDAMLAMLTRTLHYSSDYEFKLEQEVTATTS